MTKAVKNFIETNYELLDSNDVEFCYSAYDCLSIQQQKELIQALNTAGINIDRAVTLRTFIARYLNGILGFDQEWLLDYIKDNRSEWSDSVYIEKDNEGGLDDLSCGVNK